MCLTTFHSLFRNNFQEYYFLSNFCKQHALSCSTRITSYLPFTSGVKYRSLNSKNSNCNYS